MSDTTWILGAGPGIGRATAMRFLAEGHRVGLVSRPGHPLDLEGAVEVEADVFDPQALAAALDHLEARLGLPSVLVYNASTGTPGPTEALEPLPAGAEVGRAATSLLAAAARVKPAMVAAGRGTLLVTGGGIAFSPQQDLALPSAVKAVQRHLTLSLAQELGPKGIHVASLAVCGFVQPGAPLSPEAVADALWDLHTEPRGAWTSERRYTGPEVP